MPVTPPVDDPASALLINKSPLEVFSEAPPNIVNFPPVVEVAEFAYPADKNNSPPEPLFPDPTEIVILPDRPPVATPELRRIDPELPAVAIPENI
jgi:hypothetical protein